MDEIASKAADQYLQYGPLGATVVALALALAFVVIFGWRIIDKKDRRIAELEEGWRSDLRTALASVTTAVATLEKVPAALEKYEAFLFENRTRR